MSNTNSFIAFSKMIKLEHSLFALPFAFTGMILAAKGIPSLYTIIFIIIAMVGGRSAAMGLNRLIDADYDARNPRTKDRAIPKGEITKFKTLVYIIIGFILYFFAAYKLNRLAFILSPIPAAVFILYSYTKRFTSLCHVVLGIAMGFAPLGAWVAASSSLSIAPFILSAGVIVWGAGFDILYSIQDISIDKKEGLYSIPSRLGVDFALIISRIFHTLAFISFISLIFFTNLSYIYILGIIISGIFMFYEHYLVAKKGLEKLDVAFFNINAYISIIIFIFSFTDTMVFS